MNVRRVTHADLPHIRRLETRAPTAAHWNSGQYETLFAATGPERIALVAVDDAGDEPVVGFLIAHCLPEEWEIENVVVEEAARHAGIGSSLVRRLQQEAIGATGIGSIILEVRESNLLARRLYEKIGFMAEGRRKSYYRSPKEDAILYRLPLQSCDKIP